VGGVGGDDEEGASAAVFLVSIGVHWNASPSSSSRHPMYLGMDLMLIGEALLLGTVSCFRLVGSIYREHRASGASTATFVALATRVAPFDTDLSCLEWLLTAGYEGFLGSDLTLSKVVVSFR
jgi:hypothetical protein